VLQNADKEKPCNRTEIIRDCYFPCPDEGCRSCHQERYGSVCLVTEDGEKNQAQCYCPACQHQDTNWICGRHGERMISAPNLCMLQRAACLSREKYHVEHNGKCHGSELHAPLNCTVVPKFERIVDKSNYKSVYPVQTNSCDGGCGDQVGECCVPDVIRRNLVMFADTSTAQKIHSVRQIESCKCSAKSDLPPLIEY
jgi:hypothetical protein